MCCENEFCINYGKEYVGFCRRASNIFRSFERGNCTNTSLIFVETCEVRKKYLLSFEKLENIENVLDEVKRLIELGKRVG